MIDPRDRITMAQGQSSAATSARDGESPRSGNRDSTRKSGITWPLPEELEGRGPPCASGAPCKLLAWTPRLRMAIIVGGRRAADVGRGLPRTLLPFPSKNVIHIAKSPAITAEMREFRGSPRADWKSPKMLAVREPPIAPRWSTSVRGMRQENLPASPAPQLSWGNGRFNLAPRPSSPPLKRAAHSHSSTARSS